MMINIEEHLGLARSIASKYYNATKNKYSYDEIESTAYIGLIKAANKFDESKGCKFSTYAMPTIIGEIRNMFRSDKWYFVKRNVPQEMLSLNFVVDSESNVELQEILVGEENTEENIVNLLLVKKLLELLGEREKQVIYLYFYKQKSQSDIAKIVNLSQPHVSRMIINSLNKMKLALGKMVI